MSKFRISNIDNKDEKKKKCYNTEQNFQYIERATLFDFGNTYLRKPKVEQSLTGKPEIQGKWT